MSNARNEIDKALAKPLAEFVGLYSQNKPTESEISDFVYKKLVEKDVFFAIQQGLITPDEAIDLIVGHVFTKFVKGRSIELEGNDSLDKIRLSVEEFFKANV